MGATKGKGQPRTPAGKFHATVLELMSGLMRDSEAQVVLLAERATEDELQASERFAPRPKGFKPKRIFATKA